MNKGFQAGWWLTALTIALMYAISLPLLYINLEINEFALSLAGEMGLVIPILIGIFYARNNSNGICDTLGIKKFSPILLPLCVLMIIGAQSFIAYTTMPVQVLLVIMFGAETATTQMLIPNTVPSFMLAFFVLCIAAPVLEELLCRGVLIKLFSQYGFTVSVISSALAFSILHLEMRSFIQIFFIGLILATVRICSGSVVLTIIMHSVNNFLSLLQLVFLDSGAVGLIYPFLLFSALLFPVTIYITFVHLGKHLNFGMITSSVKAKTGISVAAILCFILFAGFNLMLFINRLINGYCFAELKGLLGI